MFTVATLYIFHNKNIFNVIFDSILIFKISQVRIIIKGNFGENKLEVTNNTNY